MQYDPSAACSVPVTATCSFSHQDIGFMRAVRQSHGHYWDLDAGTGCASQAGSPDGAYVGWANADGSVLIGAEVCGGQSRFGVFRGGEFTPLPLPPVLPKPPARQAPALGAYAVW